MKVNRISRYAIILLGLIITISPSYIFAEECKELSNASRQAYKIVDTCDYKDYNTEVAVYEHIKTGAHIVHWKNDDLNKGVAISYKTYPQDDSGVNHVLEHCICAGSSKYDDTNLFFNVCGKTNNTDMNATTTRNFTVYFAGSLFEKQVLKFTEMFMNCTLHPIFLRDKRVFYREAHRIELFDKDKDLTINGTVLNEMNYNNIEFIKEYHLIINSFLKGKNFYCTGGMPKLIKNINYESVVEAWERYYHPSNCVVYLYGDININTFLEFLDNEYFSHYDRKQIDLKKPEFTLEEERIDKEIIYPSTYNNYKSSGCNLYKVYAANDNNKIEDNYCEWLVKALTYENSPFITNMNRELPGVRCTAFMECIGNIRNAIIGAEGLNKEDKDRFNDIVKKSINEIQKKGFSKEIIDEVSKEYKEKYSGVFRNKEKQTNLFNRTMRLVLDNWSLYDDWKWVHNLNIIKEFDEGKLYKEIDFLINNSKEILLTAIPSDEMLSSQNKREKEELESIKNSMSDKQKDELIKFTNNMKKWLKSSENNDSYKKIKNVNIDDLNFKVDNKEVIEDYIKGIRFLSYDNGDKDMYDNSISFGMENLTKKERIIMKIMCIIFNDMRAKTHEFSRVNNLIKNNFYNIFFCTDKEKRDGKTFTTFKVMWSGENKSYDSTFKILEEILYHLDSYVLDGARVCLTELKKRLLEDMFNNSENIMFYRGIRSCKGKYTHTACSDIFELYDKVYELEEKCKDEKNEIDINEIFKNVLHKTLCSKYVTAYSVADSKEINKLKKSIVNIADDKTHKFKFDYEKEPEAKKEIQEKRPGKREAIITDVNKDSSGMVSVYPNGEKFRMEFSLMAEIIRDKYLIKKIRNQLGAYYCDIEFNSKCMLIFSDRNFNTIKTWNVIKGLVSWLDEFEISQDELDEYKIKLYCQVLQQTYYSSCLDRIYSRINEYLEFKQYQDVLDYIKGIKVSDLTRVINSIRDMISNGYYFAIGNEEKIEKEKANFDNILSIELI